MVGEKLLTYALAFPHLWYQGDRISARLISLQPILYYYYYLIYQGIFSR